MQGIALVFLLTVIPLLVGLTIREETSPVRLSVLAAIVVVSGWYLLF